MSSVLEIPCFCLVLAKENSFRGLIFAAYVVEP
jgi:hypothetical protein